MVAYDDDDDDDDTCTKQLGRTNKAAVGIRVCVAAACVCAPGKPRPVRKPAWPAPS